MLNNLIADTTDNLLKSGISFIPGEAVETIWFPAEAANQHALPNSGDLDDFHAIWCDSRDSYHITPCEGKWDVATLVDVDPDDCLIESVTLAEGADGMICVEIAWKPFMWTKKDEHREAILSTLNRLVGRVLATIALNRDMHR